MVWQLHARLLQRLLGVGVGTPSWAGQRLIKVRLAGACVDGQADPGGLHSSGDAAWKSGNRPRAIAGVDGVHPGFYLGLLWRQGARLCLHACVHAELACSRDYDNLHACMRACALAWHLHAAEHCLDGWQHAGMRMLGENSCRYQLH